MRYYKTNQICLTASQNPSHFRVFPKVLTRFPASDSQYPVYNTRLSAQVNSSAYLRVCENLIGLVSWNSELVYALWILGGLVVWDTSCFEDGCCVRNMTANIGRMVIPLLCERITYCTFCDDKLILKYPLHNYACFKTSYSLFTRNPCTVD